MKVMHLALSALAIGALPLAADVPELESLVPEAKGFELIYKFNPKTYLQNGYEIDNAEGLIGNLKRIGYLVKLTDKQDKQTWAYTEMDPFSQNLSVVGVPTETSGIIADYVTNLTVSSNVPGVETGAFEKGNIEFWQGNYGANNNKNIPGASNGKYDFGDGTNDKRPGYGSMQVHNYLKKQTVFAFNNHRNGTPDLGIGNNPKGHPDWTFTGASRNYKDAQIFVVGKFENLKKLPVVRVDASKIKFTPRLDRDNPNYKPGEPMTFTFTVDFGNQQLPKKPYSLKWKRTGDDGITKSGIEVVTPGKPITVTTSSDKPGFVRMEAWLLDHNGRQVTISYPHPWRKGEFIKRAKFDGGAGVDIYSLKQAVPEPADFDAFWAKQKARLNAVPVKYTMTEVPCKTKGVKQYAVSVDCAGPRPVTGYLTIPENAKDKSLKAEVCFHGYGTSVQKPSNATWFPKNAIRFDVNAHGYDLGKDNAYYKDFFEKIKSNGKIYAFDPKQNSDPETAYFNGMALRVMRALQFVKSLPQWNGKELNVSGGSQGGLQTIWAAGLDPQVTYAQPTIPWCADLGAHKTINRLNGWRPDYVPALDYYDIVNHAKRIPLTCNTYIERAGLGDYVCPPSGVTIIYNNIRGPKKIRFCQGSDHGFALNYWQTFTVEAK